MDRLLLLVPSTTYRAAPFSNAARALDVAVTIASEEPSTLEELRPRELLTLDFSTPETAAEQAAAFAQQHPLQAVLAVDDGATEAAAAIAERLELRHHSREAVATARDKLHCREVLEAAGLPQPAWRLVTDSDNPFEVSRELATCGDSRVEATGVGFPCVLKPRRLAASQGVIRANDADEFVSALARLRTLLKEPAIGRLAGDGVVVERYISGREVAVEALACNGTVKIVEIFDKPDLGKGPFFPEETYVAPAALSLEERQQLASTVQRAATALGLSEGAIHAELKLHDGKVWVIEIAGRSIGGLCASVLRFSGIPLEEILLLQALDRELPPLERDGSAVGVRMLYPPRAGKLRVVEGLDMVERIDGVTGVRITAHRGQMLVPPPDGGMYLGFIIGAGETPEAVVQALALAANKLDVVMRQS